MRPLLAGILIFFITICTSAQMGSSHEMKLANDDLSGISTTHSENTGALKFPSAFRWNRSGPTGGFWNRSEPNDFVFHPVFLNVNEYRLKIYSRAGKLVYTSNEIQKGWDGYLENGDLALQGVYVWIVKGRFSDGTAFDMIGDVTFLY